MWQEFLNIAALWLTNGLKTIDIISPATELISSRTGRAANFTDIHPLPLKASSINPADLLASEHKEKFANFDTKSQ